MVTLPFDKSAFAAQLNDARMRQNLSIRAAAKLAGVPAATAQGWFQGKHLATPALRGSFQRLVEALGLELPEGWWETGLAVVPHVLRTGSAPYLGLRPFGVDDSGRYFGRDGEIDRVIAAIESARASGRGLVALVGPSGSGKSSLVAAGLIARTGDRTTRLTTVSSLGRQFDRDVAEGAPDAEIGLLVVDQFEDLFRSPAAERARLLDRLESIGEHTTVLFVLRSDHYEDAARCPQLVAALERAVVLGGLGREQLRQIIVAPAAGQGVQVDPELVEVVLRDCAGNDWRQLATSVLPLLSNALLATWAAGRGDRMTVADYLSVGGLGAAVEDLAEQVYGGLSEGDQRLARAVFLRLVSVDADAVARVPLSLAGLDDATTRVIDEFAVARMITKEGSSAQISHDTLLTQWARLRDWIEEGRSELRVQQQLSRATRAWMENDMDPAFLLPVNRLPLFAPLLADGAAAVLTGDERAFLAASQLHFENQLQAERRTSTTLRRRSRIAIGFAVAAIVLAVIAGIALVQRQQTQAEAQSRQVALQATSLRSKDPNLQAQMALVAADLAPTREGRSAMLDATSIDVPLRWPGTGSAVLAKSADDRVLVRGGGAGEVTIWRGDEYTRSAGLTVTVDPAKNQIYGIALFMREGRYLLVVGGATGFLALWDVTESPRLLQDLTAGKATTYAIAAETGGRHFFTGQSDGAIHQFSYVGSSYRPTSAVKQGSGVAGLVVHPDGDLFSAGEAGKILVWGTQPGLRAKQRLEYQGGLSAICLAVSPDGHWLTAGLKGAYAWHWDLRTKAVRKLNFSNWVNALGYSADSRRLVAGDSDQHMTVIDPETGEIQRVLQGPSLVTGSQLISGYPVSTSVDGSIRVWQPNSRVLRMGGPRIYQLATNTGGTMWLAAASSHDTQMMLWNLHDGIRRVPDPVIPNGVSLSSAASISADGRHLFSGTADGRVIHWPLTPNGAGDPVVSRVFPERKNGAAFVACVNVSPVGHTLAACEYTGEFSVLATWDEAGKVAPVAQINTPTPQGFAFSPSGDVLVVGIGSNRLQVWSVKDSVDPQLLSTLNTDANPATLAFANSHDWVVAGTDSGSVYQWDLADPKNPVQLVRRTEPQSGIYSATFKDDDSGVIVGGADELFWYWHATDPSGAPASFALNGVIGRTLEGRFIQRGTTFAGSGGTGAIRLWTLDEAAAKAGLCSWIGQPLTPDEWARYLPGITPRDPCR